MNFRDFVDAKSRRNALENNLKIDLSNIGYYSFDEEQVSKKNCENMIGAIQIPLGVAGPLVINSKQEDKRQYFIPLATTEGALVASVNRGCRAVSMAGGVNVLSEKIGMTRAPVFTVANLSEGQIFIKWVNNNFDQIKKITEASSQHLTLLKIVPYSLGRNVWLRFFFDTQDAMGMNMATIAVTQTLQLIEEKTSARCVSVSGNVCVDKKPNFLNYIEGRGYKIWAEAIISDDIISQVLKTNVDEFIDTANRKLLYGSIISGSIGANAHFANILSAIFIATGQDPAHVSESSMGVTVAEKVKEGLYISVYLPDMVVGIVGGGTGLAAQREALNIMGIKPGEDKNTAQKLAEIIGGAVLAGELSLLASLTEGSLAGAHQKLGRGK